MQARDWLFKGGLAALIALVLTYFILEPAPTELGYGALLGWSGIVGVFAVLVQGFRNAGPQFPGNNKAARSEITLNRWGGIHTALSIAITVMIAVHAMIFFSSLWAVSLAIWLGATGFIVLLVLNASGLITESKRRSRGFGSFKRLHVILMLVVIVLSILHIELVLGPMFVRSMVGGTIVTLAVVLVVFVSVPVSLPRVE